MRWILKNKVEFSLLILILLAAAFFRFYRIGEYMTFLGDEGRDMLIMKQILLNYDLPFVGPGSSVGNVYLGPLYYYLMAIFNGIFGLNPVVGAGMVASFGVATVFLIYYLGKQIFDRWSGLIAAWLYAISPLAISYSKSSWNPNPAPFFALLTIWSVYKSVVSNNWRWLLLAGAFCSAAVQMHYLTLPLIPATAAVLFKKPRQLLIKGALGFFAGFNLVMLPWWLFEVKHSFMNIRGIKEIFFGESASVGFSALDLIGKLVGTSLNVLIGEQLTSGNIVISVIFLVLIIALIVQGWREQSYRLLGIYLGVCLVLINLYRGPVHSHYVGYLVPLVCILIGTGWRMKVNSGLRAQVARIFVVIAGVVSVVNLQNNPNLYPPNNQLQRTQEIARYVIAQAGDQPFNFALIAKSNYDSAYQFYLEEYGHKPKVVPEDKTAQLFVVCEDAECTPINHPKYEIAGFGWAKIESIEQFSGVKVFKLIANPSGKPG